eukprot:scaffold647949_cov40-Prasinocladus_malaysianus.AAC.1
MDLGQYAREAFPSQLFGSNSTDPTDDDFIPKGLSWLSVVTAALLILVNISLSVRLALGLTSRLVVAGVRCVIQLSVLGFVLEPIFNFGAGPQGEGKGIHCITRGRVHPITDQSQDDQSKQQQANEDFVIVMG